MILKQIKLLNPVYDKFIQKFNLESDLNVDCLTQMSQSKLIIIDYISTSFLEAIISNFPVIICLTKGYYLEKEYSDFFIDLEQCGIIQTDPLKLAVFVNKIKDNPNEWWGSSIVQDARNKFIYDNIDTSEVILSQIKNF
jgi:putative transferase (TIGR04331 family)